MNESYADIASGYFTKYNSNVKYKELTREEVSVIVRITTCKTDECVPEELYKEVDDLLLMKILKAKLSLFDVTMDKKATLLMSIYLYNPGMSVIAAIDMLTYLDKENDRAGDGSRKVFTYDDLINLYPFGFYDVTDESMCRNIIDMVKDKLVPYSEIY